MEEESIFTESTPVSELNNKLNSIRAEIAKVIVGQQQVVDLLMIGLL
jgi:MoxR-like ATPase